MHQEFEVAQLEDWLSTLITRQRKNGSEYYDEQHFFNYDMFLNWIASIQERLKSRSELENLHLLRDHINTQPWSCSIDDPEHQYREIGIGLITSLILRPSYPNFAGIGGWLSSSFEPLGTPQSDQVDAKSMKNTPLNQSVGSVRTNRRIIGKLLRGATHQSGLKQVRDNSNLVPQPMIRDLAIHERIEGINLREAVTKYKLSYRVTLQLIVQLACALFVGWKYLRLQLDRLDWDTIYLRRVGVDNAIIEYEGHRIRCNNIVTLTDYRRASATYQNKNYYNTGSKVELTILVYELARITVGGCYQALQDVYQYLVDHDQYYDKWLDDFIQHGLKSWKEMKLVMANSRDKGIDIIQMTPSTNLQANNWLDNIGLDNNSEEYLDDLIQELQQTTLDDLDDLLIVKNWEPFEIKWEAVRRNAIHLAYLETRLTDPVAQARLNGFNQELYKTIDKYRRKLNHHYLIFKFNHPQLIPGYREMIKGRMARLGYKAMA